MTPVVGVPGTRSLSCTKLYTSTDRLAHKPHIHDFHCWASGILSNSLCASEHCPGMHSGSEQPAVSALLVNVEFPDKGEMKGTSCFSCYRFEGKIRGNPCITITMKEQAASFTVIRLLQGN